MGPLGEQQVGPGGALAEEHQHRAVAGVGVLRGDIAREVVGVTKDIYPEFALELARTTGATYPQLADPGDDISGTEIRPRGYPAFAFLTADGEVEMTAGGIDSVEDLVDLVDSELGIEL